MKTRTALIVVAVILVAGPGAQTRGASDQARADRREPAGVEGTFVGSTPVNAELLRFLGASAGTPAELIEWSLSLTSPSQYVLRAAYGQTEPNFPGIQRDRHEVDRKGLGQLAKARNGVRRKMWSISAGWHSCALVRPFFTPCRPTVR
jgi:hypothetical protein